MGWIADLQGKTVGVDTSPFIYFIEKHPRYASAFRPFFEAVDRGEIHVVTSAVTLSNCSCTRFDAAISSCPPVQRYPAQLAEHRHDIRDTGCGATAAELRAQHNLKTPDAIQLATATDQRAAVFLTSDRDFPRLDVPEVLRLQDLSST